MRYWVMRNLAALAFAGAFFATASGALAGSLAVTRATLPNGLKVVVVNDPLAPVVTTILNYKVGSDEQSIAGQAHALEHMMFRGSATLSSSQLMDTIDITGGSFDADTQNAVTQYYFTVPSQYLDIALRLERSRATGLSLAQGQWNQERGAITQEVTQDNSNAIYRLFTKMQNRVLGGTPYAKNGLGTIASFAHQINAPQLHAFYDAWYHPNNAVYVIVGDVNGPATIAKVKQLFGNVPSATLPARPSVRLAPLKAATYRDTSDQPYTAVLIGYRTPGYDSRDYAASEILSGVLNSQRAALFGLAAAGKAYQAAYFAQTYRKIGMGIIFAAVPITTKPDDVAAMLRGIIDGYRKNGVPADLVEAAKNRAIADLEYKGDSIEGLAFEWSQALAVAHTSSPDAMLSAYRNVTVADVDRVLRASFVNATAVTAYAVPKLGGTLTAGAPMKQEDVSVPPTTHRELPVWARSILAHLTVPEQTLAPSDMTLPNGLRLIVQPEHVTRAIEVSGSIRNNPQVQEPKGQDGIADITASLLQYGTTTYSRLAYAAQLDKIAATTNTGTSFSLSVLADHFDRGMQLLADEELHPALDAADFAIVKHQELQGVTDAAKSPDHLADVALSDALYPLGDPMRRFATPASVGSISLGDVDAWYKDTYRPDLTTIVIVGDITPAAARAAVEKYFGGWTATGPTPTVLPGPVALNGPGTVHVPATGRVQSSVRLVESIDLMRKDPDWANLEVANTALTGGFYSSLLYHDLREVHGYAYAIGSTIAAGRVRSTYEVSYGSNPENVVPAEQQVIAILDGLQKTPLKPARLLRAKAMLMGDVPIREASYNGVMSLLLDNALSGLPLDQNLIDARRELDASPQSVQASVAKWIRPSDFVRVIVGPGPK